MHAHICIHIYTYVNMYACMHIYVYTENIHTHTYIPADMINMSGRLSTGASLIIAECSNKIN